MQLQSEYVEETSAQIDSLPATVYISQIIRFVINRDRPVDVLTSNTSPK